VRVFDPGSPIREGRLCIIFEVSARSLSTNDRLLLDLTRPCAMPFAAPFVFFEAQTRQAYQKDAEPAGSLVGLVQLGGLEPPTS
jgi:hypothetical protein